MSILIILLWISLLLAIKTIKMKRIEKKVIGIVVTFYIVILFLSTFNPVRIKQG